MTVDSDRLTGECRVFAQFLVGRMPTSQVERHYAEAHRRSGAFEPADGLDRAFLDAARQSPLHARLVDAWARRLLPRGALRKKLVLLLAILETSPSTGQIIDREPSRPWLLAVVHLVSVGVAGLGALAAGLFVVAPLYLKAREGKAPRG